MFDVRQNMHLHLRPLDRTLTSYIQLWTNAHFNHWKSSKAISSLVWGSSTVVGGTFRCIRRLLHCPQGHLSLGRWRLGSRLFPRRLGSGTVVPRPRQPPRYSTVDVPSRLGECFRQNICEQMGTHAYRYRSCWRFYRNTLYGNSVPLPVNAKPFNIVFECSWYVRKYLQL